MGRYLDTISRKFGIEVESGVATASHSGDVVSGRWASSPRVWTPRSWPRSIAEELLNSIESVSVERFPDVVVEFTKKYGVLTLPFKKGESFRFAISEWLSKRAELDATWRVVSSLRGDGGGRPIRIWMDKGERFEFSAGHLRFHTNNLDTYVNLEIAAVPPIRLRICQNRLSQVNRQVPAVPTIQLLENQLNDCKAPYFIATDLRDRYCSKDCSSAAVREAKLRWWNENRRELRGESNVPRKTR